MQITGKPDIINIRDILTKILTPVSYTHLDVYQRQTQNIDGLHQAAGSREVLELHGSVHRNYCTRCGRFYSLDDILKADGVPVCDCGGVIKPDVVLYEEGLDQDVIQRSVEYISRADVLIIGGTSLTVYPAAGLIDYYRGSKLVLINKSVTSRDGQADLVICDLSLIHIVWRRLWLYWSSMICILQRAAVIIFRYRMPVERVWWLNMLTTNMK